MYELLDFVSEIVAVFGFGMSGNTFIQRDYNVL